MWQSSQNIAGTRSMTPRALLPTKQRKPGPVRAVRAERQNRRGSGAHTHAQCTPLPDPPRLHTQ